MLAAGAQLQALRTSTLGRAWPEGNLKICKSAFLAEFLLKLSVNVPTGHQPAQGARKAETSVVLSSDLTPVVSAGGSLKSLEVLELSPDLYLLPLP